MPFVCGWRGGHRRCSIFSVVQRTSKAWRPVGSRFLLVKRSVNWLPLSVSNLTIFIGTARSSRFKNPRCCAHFGQHRVVWAWAWTSLMLIAPLPRSQSGHASGLLPGPPHSDDMQRKSRIFAQNLSSTYGAGSPKNGAASQNHLDLFRHLKKREGYPV